MMQNTINKIIAVTIAVMALTIPVLQLISTVNVNNDTDILFYFAENLTYNKTYLLISTLFALIFLINAIFALSCSDFSKEIRPAIFHTISAIIALYSSNLMFFFVMWEFMTLGSIMLILNGNNKSSIDTCFKYTIIHILGSTIFLFGIILKVNITGDFSFPSYNISFDSFIDIDTYSLSGILILFGMLINIACPPFASWLPNSYSASSPIGTIFLSTYATKVAMCLILSCFFGSQILLYVGSVMTLYGTILSTTEDDPRRFLCYSIIAQLGLMLSISSVDSQFSKTSLLMYMCNILLCKTLLFMIVGYNCIKYGRISFNQYTQIPKSIIDFMGIIATLSLMGTPFTLGYLAKSFIFETSTQNQLTSTMLYSIILALIFIDITLLWQAFLKKYFKFDNILIPPLLLNKANQNGYTTIITCSNKGLGAIYKKLKLDSYITAMVILSIIIISSGIVISAPGNYYALNKVSNQIFTITLMIVFSIIYQHYLKDTLMMIKSRLIKARIIDYSIFYPFYEKLFYNFNNIISSFKNNITTIQNAQNSTFPKSNYTIYSLLAIFIVLLLLIYYKIDI
jgi:formate hydrogenlyase subunit 3/multisubunit Na+/H+ antiporter MnhD subunit